MCSSVAAVVSCLQLQVRKNCTERLSLLRCPAWRIKARCWHGGCGTFLLSTLVTGVLNKGVVVGGRMRFLLLLCRQGRASPVYRSCDGGSTSVKSRLQDLLPVFVSVSHPLNLGHFHPFSCLVVDISRLPWEQWCHVPSTAQRPCSSTPSLSSLSSLSSV